MLAYLSDLLRFTKYFALPDFIILGAIFSVILLLFLTGVAMRKNTALFTLIWLVSSIAVCASPLLFEFIMERHLKRVEFTLNSNSTLAYDSHYFVQGSIKNDGRIDFRGCVVRVDFLPTHGSRLSLLRARILPPHRHIHEISEPLKVGQSVEFKIVIPNPNEAAEYKLNTKGACY